MKFRVVEGSRMRSRSFYSRLIISTIRVSNCVGFHDSLQNHTLIGISKVHAFPGFTLYSSHTFIIPNHGVRSGTRKTR